MWLMLPMYILCLVIGLTTTTFGIWYVIDGDPDGILMSVTGLVFVFFRDSINSILRAKNKHR